jgi:hypothetical protein
MEGSYDVEFMNEAPVPGLFFYLLFFFTRAVYASKQKNLWAPPPHTRGITILQSPGSDRSVHAINR